ncbi:ankyrin repeat-containing domain protein, partial [Podospora aff. communis PSN243]
HGRNSFSWAAGGGWEDFCRLLMRWPEVNPSARDRCGRTAFSWAAANGFYETCQLLIQSYPNILSEDCDDRKRTPLWWAAKNGHTEVVRILLGAQKGLPADQLGLDLDSKDNDGETAFTSAARDNHGDVMRFLIQTRRKDSDVPSSLREWASRYLHQAARMDWAGLAKILIEEISNIVETEDVSCRTQDLIGDTLTPLCVAAEMGSIRVMRVLLKAGAAVNFTTSKAKDTPLLLALRNREEEVAAALIESGADTQHKNTLREDTRALATRGKLDLDPYSFGPE